MLLLANVPNVLSCCWHLSPAVGTYPLPNRANLKFLEVHVDLLYHAFRGHAATEHGHKQNLRIAFKICDAASPIFVWQFYVQRRQCG